MRMNPPEDLAVLVLDFRGHEGAIQIVDSQSDEYLHGVGTEQKGNLVMIPWKKEWWFYCIGITRVAYVRRKP